MRTRLLQYAILPLLSGLLTVPAHAQTIPQFSQDADVVIPVAIGGSATATVNVNASSGVSWQISNASGAPWLSISPMSGAGAQTITFTVDGRLFTQAGQQSALVYVTLPGSTAGDYITVRANAGGSSSSTLNADPATVVLDGISGQALVQRLVTLANTVPGTSGTQFSINTSTATGVNWLSVTTTSNATPAILTVTGNQTGLATGRYEGTITVTPLGGAPLQIPVVLNANGTGAIGFALGASQLVFGWQTGTAAPAAQQVAVTSLTGTQLNYTATAVSNGNWLRVATASSPSPSTTTSGVTGSNLFVSIDPGTLTSGIYNGTVRVEVPGYSAREIAVQLNVNSTGVITAFPGSLSFSHVPGSSTLPAAQTFTVSSGTGAIVNYSVTAQSTGWLFASPPSGSTQAGQNVVTVQVIPTGLAAGTYTGNVIVNTGTSTINVPVTLTVGTAGATVFNVNPTSLTFQVAPGATAQSQLVSIASLFGGSESFLASAQSSGGWLTVAPQFGQTPNTLTVSASAAAITTPGSYSGTINLQSLTTLGTQIIPVTLIVGSGVTVTPGSLTFTGNAGGAAPASQTINIGGTASTFTASSNVGWLQVSPTSGTSPNNLTISVAPSGLAAGQHNGAITVVAGGQTFTVPVSLTLNQAVEVNVSATALTFAHQTRPGQAPPPAQTVRVTSPAGSVNFTASVSSGATSWLTVSPASGTTPADLSISVNPTGLPVGSQTGTVTVSGPGGAIQRTITVTLTITNPPAATISAITNSASLAPTAIAPGLLVTIWGTGFGGGTGMNGQVTGGRWGTQVGNTRVLFDGLAAPLLYVGESQINAIVPYGVYGRLSTRLQVEVNGVRSEAVELRVVNTAPAVFPVILNENGSINSPTNPARRGSVIVFWATGEGIVSPPAQDGELISATNLRRPVDDVRVNFGGAAAQGGVPALLDYFGSAPALVSGVMQVNARIPANAPTGNSVPIILSVGDASSTAAATVAIAP